MEIIYYQEVYDIFRRPGEVSEIREIGFYGKGPWVGYSKGKGIVSGYFDNPEDFAKAAYSLDNFKSDEDRNIYFLLNPCNPALLARAHNRLKSTDTTTADKDILCCRWLLIDTDPARPKGISATDEQVTAALECRDAIVSWLVCQGWPEPITALSGNGGHALFRLPDLPNSPQTIEMLKRILKSINAKFSNGQVGIDEQVFNPARITKLYGTMARKGDNCDLYKHRRSCLDRSPVSPH